MEMSKTAVETNVGTQPNTANTQSQASLFLKKSLKETLKFFALLVESMIGMLFEFLKPSNYTYVFSLIIAFYVARELRYIILYAQYDVGKALDVLLSAIQYAINKVLNGLNDLESGATSVLTFGIYHRKGDIKTVNFIDDVPFVKEMENIMSQCNRVDTIEDEIFFFFRLIASPYVCPLVRYTYPIRVIYDILKFILGPFIYNPYPNPGCRRSSVDTQCELANIYRFMEIFLIIFLIKIFWKHFRRPIEYLIQHLIINLYKQLRKEIYMAMHKRVATEPPVS